MPTLFMYEPNKEVHNPIESSTDNPEQEEKEESQESEENEETEELEVSSSNVANQKECLQFSDMNYYYLFISESISPMGDLPFHLVSQKIMHRY